MKIIFAGTPHFSAQVLQAIIDAGMMVSLVLTQPDRPKGRGMKLMPSPVKELAQDLYIPVFQPKTLKDADVQAQLQYYAADVMVVVAYGLILPQDVLNIPKYGCLNIHASLLPRWRGAAPIQRAIEAGDKKTGICIMQMDAGLDTGDVLLQQECEIGEQDTAKTLQDKLVEIASSLIVASLQQLQHLVPKPQNTLGVTYAQKLSKDDAKIDWSLTARDIVLKIRAFNPMPVAWTEWQGQMVKLWSAREIFLDSYTEAPYGSVAVKENGQGLIISTGQGFVEILELQMAGGKRMPVSQFITGHPIKQGDVLGENH